MKRKRKKMKTNQLGIIIVFILVIAGILLTATFVQYVSTGTSFVEDLSLILSDKCTGSLSLTTTTGCVVKAKVLISDCNGMKYEINEGSCFGSIKCQDMIKYDSLQATCSWPVNPGNYEYVLCVNNIERDSGTVVC